MSHLNEEPLGELTLAEWAIVSGTPDRPACCGSCRNHSLVFNRCLTCGADEQVRYGCQHRIGLGNKCAECRSVEQADDALRGIRGDPVRVAAWLAEVMRLLDRVGKIQLVNNRHELLAAQVKAGELYQDYKRVAEDLERLVSE